jgi:transposase
MVRGMLNKFSLNSLLFLDESGINLAMTRLYAWADVGQRAMAAAPRNWGSTTTVVSALGLRGVVAPLVLKGAMDGETFENYVRQFLVRELHDCDIVVMDNLSAHKRPIIRELIREAGAWLVYLPPYSPHLSPIELAWSKVKALLCSAAARTYEELISALADALRSLTASDVLGWFRHCGYLPCD